MNCCNIRPLHRLRQEYKIILFSSVFIGNREMQRRQASENELQY